MSWLKSLPTQILRYEKNTKTDDSPTLSIADASSHLLQIAAAGDVLVVRPDRYVYAKCKCTALSATVKALRSAISNVK